MKNIKVKNENKNLRQGDIYINTTDEDIKLTNKTKILTLQRGEFTGHSHRVVCEQELDYAIGADGSISFKVPCNALILHEEHNPVVVVPGVTYTISPSTNEREYDYFTKKINQVRD